MTEWSGISIRVFSVVNLYACVSLVSYSVLIPFFKYFVGDTADLVDDFMTSVDEFRREKRFQPSARPRLPFPSAQLEDGYHPKMWLRKFDGDMLQAAKEFNILAENFPERFNPVSIVYLRLYL